MSTRQRWHGDIAALACCLHINRPGDFKYGEDDKAKLDVALIQKQRKTLLALSRLDEKMNFTTSDIKRALEDIADKKDWSLTPSQRNSFVAIVSKRIRNMLRHFTQARGRKKPPQWALDLTTAGPQDEEETQVVDEGEKDSDGLPDDGSTDGEPMTEEESEDCEMGKQKEPETQFLLPDPSIAAQSAATTPTNAGKYFYGWDAEQEAAYRREAGKRKPFEYTTDIRSQPNEWDPCIARWPDGSEHPICDLLSLTWNTKQASGSAKRSDDSQTRRWKGTSPSGAPVRLNSGSGGTIAILKEGKGHLVQIVLGKVDEKVAYQVLTQV